MRKNTSIPIILKPILIATTAVLMTATSKTTYAADVLTGDTRLACEAILCLSSGVRPGECTPSLDRYFGIKHKYWSDTVRSRINFLNLCPAGSAQGMDSRIKSIAHGAGRCDADYLNKHNTYTYSERKCTRSPGAEDGYTCGTVTRTVISNELPKYCGAYNNHEWSYRLDIKYIGDPKLGGKWVEPADYEREKAAYDQKIDDLSKTKSGRQLLRSIRERNSKND